MRLTQDNYTSQPQQYHYHCTRVGGKNSLTVFKEYTIVVFIYDSNEIYLCFGWHLACGHTQRPFTVFSPLEKIILVLIVLTAVRMRDGSVSLAVGVAGLS